MKTVHKMILVFSVIAVLAGFECILNCSCNLVAYPVPQRTTIFDNTRPEESKKLTLLIYMAADNDLERYALQNLKALERADFCGINVLVLLDRSENYDETNENWTDTRLFEVTHDNTNGSSIVSERLDCPPLGLSKDLPSELDMGNYNVLKAFIEFGKASYKSENYALILWGHGTGWRYSVQQSSSRAVAIDDKSNSYMCVKELGLALKDQSLCVIGFDTCFGSVFENLYELKECAQYIVASPGITSAAGWNYKKLMEDITSSDFSSESIATIMSRNSNAQTTITPTSQLSQIMISFETFAEKLSSTITNESTRSSVLETLLHTQSYTYSEFPCDMYLDIFSMAGNFTGHSDNELAAAARQLQYATSVYAIGIFFIQKNSAGTLAVSHSPSYIKSQEKQNQCSFIKESLWWVPTVDGSSESILDKLFYTSF